MLEVEGREEESALIPAWVLTGYWLSPDAPVVISPGSGGRRGDVVALHVRHRDGQLPFEVLVDAAKGVPLRVRPAVGVPIFVVEIEDVRRVNGRTAPRKVRLLQHGTAVAEFENDAPVKVALDAPDWSPPVTAVQASYDAQRTSALETRGNGRGFLYVRPAINGERLGWFLFDTGAPSTIVDSAVVERLGLVELTEGLAAGVGGTADIHIHAVESIRLGPVRLAPGIVASRDLTDLAGMDLRVDGILGCDVLGQAVVEYDLAAGSVSLHDAAGYELPPGASWERILRDEGKPVARARFEDHEGEFLVDTAASGALAISWPMVQRLDLLSGRRTRTSISRGVGGSVPMRSGTVRWLELGGKAYPNVPTQFAVSDQGSFANPFPDGIVGIELIRDRRVVFDLARRRVAFLDRDEPPAGSSGR